MKARLRQFAVADDIDAKLGLLFDDFRDRPMQFLAERIGIVALAGHAGEQPSRQRQRARQAADVGRDDAVAALFDQGHDCFRDNSGEVNGALA